MYSKAMIYRDAKQIVNDSKGIEPYVIIAQPRRDLQEMAAQQLDGPFLHIDVTGFSRGFVNCGGEKTDVARNYLIERCLQSEAKYMLFVGEDTVLPYDGFLRLHETCETQPGAIAIGVYYMKAGNPMIMVMDGKWIKTANVTPGQLFPVHAAGMDAMLIPISVLRKMKEAEPDNPFCCIINNLQVDEETHVEFIGEDNYFYNRCHQMGIPILCNTDVQCLHMDLATGKYTAHESVDLGIYITNMPPTTRLTLADKKYLEHRWVSRLPDGTYGVPQPAQVPEELDKLMPYVKGRKLILEIGTEAGGTLYRFIHAADPEAEIVSIDLPGSTGQPPEAEMMGWKLPGQTLHILRADSHVPGTLEAVRNILHGRKFDFTFIDGDHTYQGVKRDYEMYHELCDVMAFHDIVRHPQLAVGVQQFWSELGGTKVDIIANPNQGWAGIGVLENQVADANG